MLLEPRRFHHAVEGHELDDDQPHPATNARRADDIESGAVDVR